MYILAMLLLLSVLILVHELGHFGVARALGLKVDRFGFGLPFGPILYETNWGDTKICIHAFLLGGYVSFPDDDEASDLPLDDYRRINNRPVWQRALVVSAGVIANAITAFILVLIVAGFSGQMPSGKYNVIIANVQKNNTEANLNQDFFKKLKPNDKIIAANGSSIDTPITFISIVQRSKTNDNFVTKNLVKKQLESIVSLNPELKSYNKNSKLPNNKEIKLPKASYETPIKLQLQDLMKEYKPDGIELTKNEQKTRNELADKAIYKSDSLLTLENLATATSDTVHPVTITVERNGKQVVLPAAYPNKEGLIGIKLMTEEIMTPTKNPVSAITGSWDYLSKNTYLMIDGLVKLFSGQVPLKNLHGIVAITKVGGDIIQKNGIWDGLLLTALISMDLAIVNLLPIPALDGGHLMFLFIEKLRGRPINKDTQERIAKYGFIFLIGLMILIICNDIYALILNKI